MTTEESIKYGYTIKALAQLMGIECEWRPVVEVGRDVGYKLIELTDGVRKGLENLGNKEFEGRVYTAMKNIQRNGWL